MNLSKSTKLEPILQAPPKSVNHLATEFSMRLKKVRLFLKKKISHFSRVFSQIEKTPIGKLTNINFYWEESYRNLILSSETALSLGILKKLFLLLEDYNVASKIKSGATIIAKMGKVNVYVDLSRLDRVLNFSFNQKRIHRDSTFYINRMRP